MGVRVGRGVGVAGNGVGVGGIVVGVGCDVGVAVGFWGVGGGVGTAGCGVVVGSGLGVYDGGGVAVGVSAGGGVLVGGNAVAVDAATKGVGLSTAMTGVAVGEGTATGVSFSKTLSLHRYSRPFSTEGTRVTGRLGLLLTCNSTLTGVPGR